MLMNTAVIDRGTRFDEYDLKCILKDSGYDGMAFESAEFLGINEYGQFVYEVKFFDDGGFPDDEELEVGKVFVKYVSEGHYGKFLADF